MDIWERGNTFPAHMITSFKEKLNAPANRSTTPEGSPGPNSIPYGNQQQQQPANGGGAPDTSSILKALADMAKQSTPAPAAPAAPAPAPAPAAATPANPLGALNPQGVAPQTTTAATMDQAANPYAAGAMATAANPFAALGAMNPSAMVPPQSQSQTPPNPMAAAQNPLAALLPQATAAAAPAPAPAQPAAPPAMGPDALQQQLQLLQLLAAQGIPQDQWATALQILTLSNASNMNNGLPGAAAATAAGFGGLPGGQGINAWTGRPDSQTRDLDPRDRDYMRSPPGQYRRRSRSPGGAWDRRRDVSPPRRRDSPIYGEYHGDSPGRRGDPRDARGRRDYRQRSPPGRRRRSPSPRNDPGLPPPGPKLIEWDYSIGQGNVKGTFLPFPRPPSIVNYANGLVLSRTLFVGGVTSSEAHLRSLFNKFGLVQTCIVNTDKRHAFIKMICRDDAVLAREGMESYKSGDMQLRVSRYPLFLCHS